MSPIKLTRNEAKQVLASVINYPLFVPELGEKAKRALVSGELTFFAGEIERLSALGSRPASALLAYLHMKGALGRTADLDHAEGLCGEAARNGDAYSQYVLGWICRAAGRNGEAIGWLRKAAAKGLFLPAIVDVARFMAGGIGVEADARAAIAVLWDAHKLGHRMALVYIAELLKATSSSSVKRVLGASLYPIAVVRATTFTHRYPLSERVFVTSISTKLPLFRVPVSVRS